MQCVREEETLSENLYLYWLVTVRHGGQQNLPKHHLTVVHHQRVGGLLGQQWVASVQRVRNRQTQTVPMIPKSQKRRSDAITKQLQKDKQVSDRVPSPSNRVIHLNDFSNFIRSIERHTDCCYLALVSQASRRL